MVVTFPHFGPLSIAVSKLLEHISVEHIVSPRNDDETLQCGSAMCPEEICIPFKYMAGNLKAAYELGADTALMMATNGPCRLGEYCELLNDVLRQDGCLFEWILLDTPSVIGTKEFIRRLGLLRTKSGTQCSRSRLVKGVVSAVRLIKELDTFRSLLMQRAGYLKSPEDALELLRTTMRKLEEAADFKTCFEIISRARRELAGFAYQDNAEPVKILVTGEIYTSVEPEANGRIEETLVQLGCSVKRHIDVSWWINHTVIDMIFPENVKRIFTPVDSIRHNVGGYGRETAAKIAGDRWSDGIIKIMPAGCMPEIVTKAFCENLQEHRDVRVLNLIYDEMHGQAGYETRVEAFVDMLERRKHVLAGNRHRLHKHRYGADG